MSSKQLMDLADELADRERLATSPAARRHISRARADLLAAAEREREDENARATDRDYERSREAR